MKHKAQLPTPPEFPQTFETFRRIGAYEVTNLEHKEPSSLNGRVAFRKYRVTIEEIAEPVEVLKERLLKLWHNEDNHHHWQPLKWAAKTIGIELLDEEFGKNKLQR